jgi:hypothetical protein
MSRTAFVPQLAFLLALGFAASVGRAEESLDSRRAALEADFAAKLAQIAAKCDELGLAEQARVTRQWLPERDPSRLYVFLAGNVESPPADASQHVRYWHEAFLKARRTHAAALFELGKQSLDAEHVRDSFLLLHETLYHDPEHADARRILGAGEIAEPATRPVRAAHPNYGWAAGKHWRIDSEHYQIKTNSLEDGRYLVRRLEELYSAWRQVFAEYWLDEAEVRRAFDGAALPSGLLPGDSRRKLAAVLFHDREEYVARLRPSQPQIELTEGYYSTEDRVAYFFAGKGSAETTWLHEATHQIFYEMSGTAPRAGLDANFWMIEAPALYMESLASHGGHGSVGGFDAERLQYARFRALSQGETLPLAELAPLGRDGVQRHEQIRGIYSQAAGLAHFFLDGSDGPRRRAFLLCLAAVHQGRDRPETLAQLTDTDYADLDRQYREFLNVTDADLAASRPPGNIAMLSLGGTAISDAAMSHLSRYPNLTWLNLANTRITDESMSHVARLKLLETLYLTGTSVSDVGARPLEALAKLKSLDVQGSRVTEEGWRRLQEAIPDLMAPE